MPQHSNTISLDYIRAWSRRKKLIESDLTASDQETERQWSDVARLIVTRRAEEAGVREILKNWVPDLILSESEIAQVLKDLASAWARRWKLFDPALDAALEWLTEPQEKTRHETKCEVLQTAIIEALHDADQEQVVRIGDDRAWGHGSDLILVQKQDIRQAEQEGLDKQLNEKFSTGPAGLRAFPDHGVLGPIEAALRHPDMEPDQVRPRELKPSLFLKWLRTAAIKRAQERLLIDAGFDRSGAPDGWREVQVRDQESDESEEPAGHLEVSALELLNVLGREDPDPLEAMIVVEDRDRQLSEATPTRREIVNQVAKKNAEGLTAAEAKQAVARERGVKINTIHKTISRFQD